MSVAAAEADRVSSSRCPIRPPCRSCCMRGITCSHCSHHLGPCVGSGMLTGCTGLPHSLGWAPLAVLDYIKDLSTYPVHAHQQR